MAIFVVKRAMMLKQPDNSSTTKYETKAKQTLLYLLLPSVRSVLTLWSVRWTLVQVSGFKPWPGSLHCVHFPAELNLKEIL